MVILIYLFLVVLLLAMILCCIILYRNEKVHDFSIKLLDKVSDLTIKDIKNIENLKDKNYDNYFLWRYEVLNKVSYNKMLYTFWKELKPENYYENLDFLKEGVKYDNR